MTALSLLSLSLSLRGEIPLIPPRLMMRLHYQMLMIDITALSRPESQQKYTVCMSICLYVYVQYIL
jgi:hypothetical protein